MKGAKTGGRKAGVPNKATQALRAAIQAADPIGFMSEVMLGRMPNLDANGKADGTFEQATQTSRMQAAQFLAKRIAPEAKENRISIDLGSVESVSDAVSGIGKAAKAVAGGEITPSEGKTMCDMLSAFVRVYETDNLTRRLEALEHAIQGGQS